MYIKDYIQAAYEVFEKDTDTERTLSALRAYLQKRGLFKLYPTILRGLMERMRRSSRSATPKIRIARESDFKQYEAEIRTHMHTLGFGDTHEIVIDTHLIGGYIIESKNMQIDKSHKKHLLTAYKRLTASN